MPKITIRFTQDSVRLGGKENFYTALYKSLGLTAGKLFDEQEFEINAQTNVTLFGMKTSIPHGLQTERSWVCRLIKKEGMLLFSVGDWILAAEGSMDSSQPEEMIAKLPVDLLVLSLEVFRLNPLPSLSGLSSLTGLRLIGCESLVDISSLSGLSSLTSLQLSLCDSLVDISALSGLSSLTSLDLSSCESLVDISAVSGLSSLTNLDLSACKSLVDISALSGLSSLTNLDLSYCQSMVDISSLSGLSSLTSLNLSRCKSLVEISALSGLNNLTSLNLSSTASLGDISALSGLSNLTTLNLSARASLDDVLDFSGPENFSNYDSSFDSLTDISALSGLSSLQSLNLSSCSSLIDIAALSGLVSLSSLKLRWCTSLVDISAISSLGSLTSLYFFGCQSLVDISALSDLSSLKSLEISQSYSLVDISSLSGLSSLTSLYLSQCDSLVDISALSGLGNLISLDLSGCDSLVDIFPLHGLKSLNSLSFTSRRIQSIEALRGIQTLREVEEFNPPEVAELLAHTACLREDRAFIVESHKDWINEAKNWRSGAQSLQDRFATTLGEAFSLVGEHPIAEDYEAFLDGRPDFSSAPWKAWFGGTLKESGFVLYRQRVERVAVSQMLSGAIGGTCTTLPYEDQPEWSRQWLISLEIELLKDAKNLLSVAPEICLAHARLDLSESLRRWLEAFTDPSDPGALDLVHAALAGFQLASNHLDAAESHVFAIESRSLRDPVLADLISSYPATDSDRASAQLLLIAAPATRRELAKTLVTIPEFSMSEVAMHRLFVAMDDSPEALGELIALLPSSSAPSQLIQQISASLQLDRQATLQKISDELHQQADNLLILKNEIC